ncbi:MAG: hypothetical protein K6G18_15225 [Treponema sp.]|nr:hypothetical protein [Treponema sp.]
MKKIQLLAALSAVLIGFCACSGNELPSLSGNEAREAFASSKNIRMKARKTAIHVSSDIEADGAVAGHATEKGFFDSSYVYSIDGEKQFCIRHVWTEDPAFANSDYNSGETEAYYDRDGSCLGYMQALYRQEGKGPDFLFFDARGNPKGYYIPGNSWTQQGAVIYGRDGKKAGSIEVRRRRGLLMRYRISISLDEGAAAELSEMDRVAMLRKTEAVVSTTRYGFYFSIKPIGADGQI